MSTATAFTGNLNLLGSEIQSDGIPTAVMGCEPILVGSVPVYQPIIQTRQLNGISRRGFAFTLGTKETLGQFTSRNPSAPHQGFLLADINQLAALELVIVSQGNAYVGTTLTRGDYTLVCVPQVDLPPANQICYANWSAPLGTPNEGWQHNMNGVFAAGDAIVLSNTIQDAHDVSGDWTSTKETVLPLSGTNAVAYANLLDRASKWARRDAPFWNRSELPIRTYVTARAPYLTGGAGCSLNIIGAYVRAVY